jgi:hypothetical protein
MRPRLIANAPPASPNATPFERFTEFARKIAAVPKAEADRVESKANGKKKKL